MSSNEYMNNYMKKRYKERKIFCLNFLGGECVNCGETRYEFLQFDHIVRNSKEEVISNMMLWAKKRLIEELKKCQILCEKCHQEKTLIESGKKDARKNHGTISSYRYCKCELCKKAKSLSNKKYKKKKNNSSL